MDGVYAVKLVYSCDGDVASNIRLFTEETKARDAFNKSVEEFKREDSLMNNSNLVLTEEYNFFEAYEEGYFMNDFYRATISFVEVN